MLMYVSIVAFGRHVYTYGAFMYSSTCDSCEDDMHAKCFSVCAHGSSEYGDTEYTHFCMRLASEHAICIHVQNGMFRKNPGMTSFQLQMLLFARISFDSGLIFSKDTYKYICICCV
jgi:hypothetical protein